jgi:ABC-type Fe3+-hydroxamate transport system substrate-binding protein
VRSRRVNPPLGSCRCKRLRPGSPEEPSRGFSRGIERVGRAARLLSCAARLFPLLPLLSCAPEPAPAAAPATRVVSLIPSLTEVLFAIGAGGRVVGRTRWCDYPPAALAVPVVGDGIAFDPEAVAARRPDLVALYPSAANRSGVLRLRALGIPTVELKTDSLDQLGPAARALGRLTGLAARADSVARAFEAALDSARRAPAPERRPSVLLLAWDNPPIVIGGGSFQSELVALAGGANAFADLPQPSAPVSMETIAARDPDIVLLSDSLVPGWTRRPEWRTVRAVREGRFAFILGGDFARPSFRALDAARRLRAALERAAP